MYNAYYIYKLYIISSSDSVNISLEIQDFIRYHSFLANCCGVSVNKHNFIGVQGTANNKNV